MAVSHILGQVAHLLRLGWFDLRHERWFILSASCVLAATMAPLLTLLSLERGVVGALIDSLERDPFMRMVVPSTSGVAKVDEQWLAKVRAWPEVAFVVPTVRSAAALAEAYAQKSGVTVNLALQPTLTSDPLLGGIRPPGEDEVILNAASARRLKVGAGDELLLLLSRQRDGTAERVVIRLTIPSLLPETSSESPFSLVHPQLLEAIEAWRDGYTVGRFGESGNGPQGRREMYPLFRLHTHSIIHVQTVADRFESEGVDVRIRGAEIAATLGLRRNLIGIFAVVAIIGAAGALVALAALQFSTLQRKRRDHALLRLTGYGSRWLLALATLNALAVALAGSIFAMLLLGVAAKAINDYFAQYLAASEAAVRVLGSDLVAAVIGAIAISVAPAIWAGVRASRYPIADELREV
jgi:putative ABC transport system permease protein